MRLTFIRLALLSQLPSCFDRCLTAELLEVLIAHDFATDKLVFEVRAVEKMSTSVRLVNDIDNTH